ncbi:MAG: SDR family oxidoreductase [Spirochaetaceae bacterium]|jgi:nucleoside-diphosphate-sugar epimerase|nr:SDR family oxidoreductase [Spirochaetaceae bacterium]
MKALLIGGTGTISAAISRKLLERGWELWLLNRATRNTILPAGVKEIHCDITNEADAAEKLKELSFDVVADFIIMRPEQAERDYRLFKDKTRQYIFISSASVYQKPPTDYLINESTPHINPFWEYSQNKIACEDFFIEKYRKEGFPITIVLPSHTYDERKVPVALHGDKGSWQVLKRIIEGKPVIIPGDGASLWTLTHNSDFAEGFIGLMGNIHALGQMVQICSDESLTWNQIYQVIAAALEKPLKAVHVSSEFLASAAQSYDVRGGLLGDKANSVVFDCSKLKRLVPGFSAAIRFDQGVRKTIEHVLSHPECRREDPEFDTWCDKIIAVREKALRELSGKDLGSP